MMDSGAKHRLLVEFGQNSSNCSLDLYFPGLPVWLASHRAFLNTAGYFLPTLDYRLDQVF